MAKIAGRKNDGAWFRTNTDIKNLSSTSAATLATLIADLDTFLAAYTVVGQYITDTGVSPTLFPDSPGGWALELAHGIPRQIWFGVTTYDYYNRSGSEGGGFKYEKLMQGPIFQFSVDLRKLLRSYIFAVREVKGLKELKGEYAPTFTSTAKADRPAYMAAKRKAAEVEFERLMATRPAKNRLTDSTDESKGAVPRADSSRSKGEGRRPGKVVAPLPA